MVAFWFIEEFCGHPVRKKGITLSLSVDNVLFSMLLNQWKFSSQKPQVNYEFNCQLRTFRVVEIENGNFHLFGSLFKWVGIYFCHMVNRVYISWVIENKNFYRTRSLWCAPLFGEIPTLKRVKFAYYTFSVMYKEFQSHITFEYTVSTLLQ